jgi:trehalose 6-phosphate phosphatase
MESGMTPNSVATGLHHAAQPPLTGVEGLKALSALLRERALFAFDFDGTLAGIRPTPHEVRVAPPLARRLAALARARPVAIVTGRRIADVRDRLGFEPAWIVGNHGAEDAADPEGAARCAHALDPLRAVIAGCAGELEGAGVMIEDKRQSIALHFRNAPDRARAKALIERVLDGRGRGVGTFGGKLVFNAIAADAPDKAHAVRALLARAGASNAFFAGDDINDEPVFAAAEPGWVTVRLGREHRPSHARFCLEGPHAMPDLIDRILGLIPDAQV